MSSEMEREAPETTATNELIHARNITSQQSLSLFLCSKIRTTYLFLFPDYKANKSC